MDKLIIYFYFDSWFLDNDIVFFLFKFLFNLSVSEVFICFLEVIDI